MVTLYSKRERPAVRGHRTQKELYDGHGAMVLKDRDYHRRRHVNAALALGFVPPNGKDQRLAALGSAITHDDARESFASCGSAYSRPWTFTSQAD